MSQGTRNFRSIIASVVILAGLALMFFNKMAFSNLILARGDTFLYFYPYWHAAAEALSTARVPFWNPDIFMGAPLLANSQAGFFYPFNWPLWLLLDTPYALNGSIILHIVVASLGAYLAGRHVLSLNVGGALVTASSFALGGYLTAQVEHINQLQGLAWLPWLLVAVSLVKVGDRRLWLFSVIGTAVLFALQLLAGHTQTTFITIVALLIWITAGWLSHRFTDVGRYREQAQEESPLFTPLIALFTGGLLALALAATQLLPTLELTGYSSRAGGLPVNEVLSFSLPPLLLSRSLLPSYGQALFTEYVAFYPLVILVLAIIGGWQWRKNPRVFPTLALVVSGLFLAFGAYNPVYWLLARLPGFSSFRAPARWLVLYALGLSLLAGVGWQLLWTWAGSSWSERQRKRVLRHSILPPLLFFIVVVLLLVLWGFVAGHFVDLIPLGPEAPFERPSTWTIAGWLAEVLLLVILLAVAAYADSVRLRRLSLLAMLAVGLAAGFLASRELPYNNLTTPEAFFDLRPSTTRLLVDGRTPPERLLSLSEIFFDPGDQAEIDSIYIDQLPEQALYDYTVAIKEKEIIAPNLPMVYDLASVDGFDGGILPLRSYSRLMGLILPDGQETTDGRLRENLQTVPEARWLDLFNARYLITDKTGDEWHDGVYYDRQHPAVINRGQSVSVGALPDYEATELRLLATGTPEAIKIETQDGDTWSLQPELIEGLLFRATFPRPAVLDFLEINGCVNKPVCTLEGLTVVDTRDDTFQALVPGDYRLIHSGDVKLYENLDVLPRAFIVDDWQIVDSDEEVLAMMRSPAFDARLTAVIEVEPEQDIEVSVPNLDGDPGQATIETYGPERIIIRTNSPSGGLLVLTDAYYPGWTATIDGQSVPVFRADGLFRAIFIPEGEHDVHFQFDSAAYRAGLTVFILSVVIIILMLSWLLVNSRQER